ncbi:MAG: electron transfer flavoprotein subunit alpha/FixB family protein [Sporolactobacillus sp.]|jgi:electron transfer flavoprotein alpha subunit|nr:electron transfer flavoprotein subunit alpha/FixB family protein [Sporolactobacillus sp.]
MKIEEYKNIWVFIERNEDQIKNISLEALGKAKELAGMIDQKVFAILIGNNFKLSEQLLANYGADELISANGEADSECDIYTEINTFNYLIKKYKPLAILFGATKKGNDLASAIAAKFQTSAAINCTDVQLNNSSKIIEWQRDIHGGNLIQIVSSPKNRPQIGTVRSGTTKKVKYENNKEIPIIKEPLKLPKRKGRVKIEKIIPNKQDSGVKLEDAKIIVSGGMGMGSANNFGKLKDLAHLLNAAIGGTRAVIDAGWLSPERQIGQSGKTVSPDLYIACGISGAIQHLSGMKKSKVIIAINKDPDAPIFKIADYAVIGDVNKILPAMINKIKNAQATLNKQ